MAVGCTFIQAQLTLYAERCAPEQQLSAATAVLKITSH